MFLFTVLHRPSWELPYAFEGDRMVSMYMFNSFLHSLFENISTYKVLERSVSLWDYSKDHDNVIDPKGVSGRVVTDLSSTLGE